MKLAAQAFTALALLALASPALPCGFDKHTTTTTTAPPPAASPSVAKAEKQRPVKAQKAKAPSAPKATATAAN